MLKFVTLFSFTGPRFPRKATPGPLHVLAGRTDDGRKAVTACGLYLPPPHITTDIARYAKSVCGDCSPLMDGGRA